MVGAWDLVKEKMEFDERIVTGIYSFAPSDKTLAGGVGVPFVRWFGTECDYNAMVITNQVIYEIREQPSKMYSWSAWLMSHTPVELPWNMAVGILLFSCWYWTVGYITERAGFTFLVFMVLILFYYTTIGQAVAAIAPMAEVAALLFTSTFSFVLIL